jgi:hypothetical protein
VVHSDIPFSNFSNHSDTVHADSGYCPGYANAVKYDSTRARLVYESLSGVCYVS